TRSVAFKFNRFFLLFFLSYAATTAHSPYAVEVPVTNVPSHHPAHVQQPIINLSSHPAALQYIPLNWQPGLPIIYVVTPTYARLVQKAELTRLGQTLLLIPNLHWVLVEDAAQRTSLVTTLLASLGLKNTHLNASTPVAYRPKVSLNENIEQQHHQQHGVEPECYLLCYFLSFSSFLQMRYTRRVSVWPVGFAGGLRFESPLVNASGHVIGWRSQFAPQRPFAIDMAGFAVSLRLLLARRSAYFPFHGAKPGWQESDLLRQLVTLGELEPKAQNCTKVLVWHTRTEKPLLVYEGKKWQTDLKMEV
uniref:Galactosylgalactosylxylosylprotein 3-beta-glucuronosyltransferase n=1 Tax=Eptatretus burgeri TaxID=7764 RepID=A0A8C4Q896_EPTBU